MILRILLVLAPLLATGKTLATFSCEQFSSPIVTGKRREAVSLKQVIPGQPSLGFALVQIKNKKDQGPYELPGGIFFYNRGEAVPVIEIIFEDGFKFYLPKDQHHHNRRAINRIGLQNEHRLHIPVKVLRTDHVKASEEAAYMLFLDARGDAYLGHLKAELDQPGWRIRTHWPKSLTDLIDDPFRSLVNPLLGSIGIRGADLISFGQLRIGDSLRDAGFEIPKGKELKANTLMKAIEFIKEHPELIDRWISYLSGSRSKIKKNSKKLYSLLE